MGRLRVMWYGCWGDGMDWAIIFDALQESACWGKVEGDELGWLFGVGRVGKAVEVDRRLQ